MASRRIFRFRPWTLVFASCNNVMSALLMVFNYMLIRIDVTLGPCPYFGVNNQPPLTDEQSTSEEGTDYDDDDDDYHDGSDGDSITLGSDDSDLSLRSRAIIPRSIPQAQTEPTGSESERDDSECDCDVTSLHSFPTTSTGESGSDVEIMYYPIPLGTSFYGMSSSRAQQ